MGLESGVNPTFRFASVGLKSFALSGHLRNITFPLHFPTFRYAACGAEILYPCRMKSCLFSEKNCLFSEKDDG
ncbi:hypothetical protein Barb7_02575 [Bacteroidales bacterium Barb7]|nr:hypothetical protein Barb7_02575 [Bacteroidales bacterium Barb7]